MDQQSHRTGLAGAASFIIRGRRASGGRALRRLAAIAMAVLVGFPAQLAPSPFGPLVQTARAAGTTRTVCADGCDFTTIQAAVTAADPGDTIQVAAGTYTENVTIGTSVKVIGAGSGSDPASATIITSASANTPVISITGSGQSSSSRLTVKTVRLTGATGSGNPGTGLFVSGGVPLSHLEFDSIVVTGNGGDGIGFNSTGGHADVVITNATISNNGGAGVRIASAVPSFAGLTVSGSTISGNSGAGISYNPGRTATSTNTAENFTISNTTFTNNAQSGVINTHDLSFIGFNGDISLADLDLHEDPSGKASHAIAFDTLNNAMPAPAISMSNVTVSGTVKKAALRIQGYSVLSGIVLSDVDVSETTTGAGWTQVSLDAPGAFDLGTTTLRTLSLANAGTVSATAATFEDTATGAALDPTVLADDFKIENQVLHKVDIGGLGLVRWSSGNVYVTPTSYLSPYTTSPSIQRGIDAADAGDTVNVAAGTYTESPTIAKALTLSGAKAATPAGPAADPVGRDTSGFVGESKIAGTVTISAWDVTVEGFAIVTSGTSVSLTGANVAIRNNILSGRNAEGIAVTGSAAGIASGNATGDASATVSTIAGNRITGGRYGMNLDGESNAGLYAIEDNYIAGVERGIQTQATLGGSQSIAGNLIEGVTVGVRLARDGHSIARNTIRNLTGASTTQAAIRVSASAYAASRGIAITGNALSGSQYGVVLEAPVAGQAYVVTGNSLSGHSISSLSVTTGTGATVDASSTWWGQATGPAAGAIVAGGADIASDPWIVSYVDDPAKTGEPGFWPTAVKASQTVSFTSTAPVNATVGGSYTATATASSGLEPSIAVSDGSSAVCSISGGLVSFLAGGTCILLADQPGDGAYAAAPPVTQEFSVARGASTVRLGSDVPTFAYGSATTVTIRVIPTAATGTARVFEGATERGSCTLAAGVCTATLSQLPIGWHTLTATYDGDDSYLSGSSNGLVIGITGAPTTTTVTVAGSAVYGQSVAIRADVSSASGTPTGSVTVVDRFGTTTRTLFTCTLSAGTCTGTAVFLDLTTHSLTATYGQSGTWATSVSAATSVSISQATTATTIVASANPASFGQSVTLTATVAPQFPGTPTGTLAIVNASTGTTLKTCASPSVVTPCSYSTAGLPMGPTTLTATYGGDGNFGGSAGAVVLVVQKAPTTTASQPSRTSIVSGQSISFAVKVVSQTGGTPTGTATVRVGSRVLSPSCTLAAGACSPTYTISTGDATPGSYTVTTTYGGDSTYAPSSSSFTLTITGATTTTTLAIAGTRTYGNALTLSASVAAVAPATGNPTGSVTFYDGSVALSPACALAATPGSGTSSSCSISWAAAGGGHSVSAVYTPAGTAYATSRSTSTVLTMAGASTTTTITGPTTITRGVYTTYTVTVSSGPGTPTGSVTVRIGTLNLGSKTLTGGAASFSIRLPSTLATGSATLSASYAPSSANFAASSGGIAVTIR